MSTANPPTGPISRERRRYEHSLEVDRAGAEIQDYLERFQEQRQLTSAEMLLILTAVEKRLIVNLIPA